MTADERALLRTICAEPDDDDPRLVYADWLDEHGQPERADFIRLQIKLTVDLADSPERRRMAFRMRELRDKHGDDFVDAMLPADDADGWRDWRFARGFIDWIEENGSDPPDFPAEVFATVPLRRLWLTHADGDFSFLNGIPADNRLRSLELSGNQVDGEHLREIAELTNLAGLSELGLMFTRLRSDSVPVLCGEVFFQRLTRLRLAGNPFTDADRQRLRDHFGDRVDFVAERDADHLYAIQDGNFERGFGRDDTQVLAVAFGQVVSVAEFDHEGNFLELRDETGDHDTVGAVRAEWWPGSPTIVVKRFQSEDGTRITDFLPRWRGLAESVGEHSEDAFEFLQRWLFQSKFCWNWGWIVPDLWLDREGRVTDT